MNKRIQELADRCWDEYPNTGPVVFNKEKFAELIISECANMCLINDPGDATYFGQQAAEKYIKQHFGVEE